MNQPTKPIIGTSTIEKTDMDLTPEAQKLMNEYNKSDRCVGCGGHGVRYEQPYGVKTICSICKGTGRKLKLINL